MRDFNIIFSMIENDKDFDLFYFDDNSLRYRKDNFEYHIDFNSETRLFKLTRHFIDKNEASLYIYKNINLDKLLCLLF